MIDPISLAEIFGAHNYAPLPAMLATAITIGILSGFRWIERWMPSQVHAQLEVRFRAGDAPAGAEVRHLLTDLGFSVARMSYRLSDDGTTMDYRTVIGSTNPETLDGLAEHLRKNNDLTAFQLVAAED